MGLGDGRVLSLLAGLVGFSFQRRDARLQSLILFACQPRHFLDRLEFFTLHDVEIAQDTLSLVAKQGVELAPHPLGHSRSVIHQTRHFVEKAVACLGHISFVSATRLSPQWRSDYPAARPGMLPLMRLSIHESDLDMPLLVIPYPAFDPVLVHIGPFAIRWYALAYIFGILIGWAYARLLIRSAKLWGGKAPMTVTDFDDFVLWVTFGIILGGRIGYVLFYNLPHFAMHPLEIFQLWNGGMSFHGGFTGCVVAVLLFGYKRGIPVLSLGDITCAVGPIGLFLGRIANFINDELWGRSTDVPWAMIFPSGGLLPRHPSQLYEAALEGLVLLAVLALLMRAGALKRPGLIIGCFAIGYAIARTFCEFFREPDAQLGFLWGGATMGQLLSVPLFLAGIGFITYALKQPLRRH